VIQAKERRLPTVWVKGRRYRLIDESDFNARFGCRLDVLGDAADLGAVVGVGGRDMRSQQMPECVDGQMQLRSFLRLAPS
jgi:hypothetical protein